jgi:hypothetical protein
MIRPSGATPESNAAHRLLADRHKRVGVVGRNRDRIDLLRDQRIDDGDLFLGRRLGRAGIDQFDIAEFFSRLEPAVAAGVEKADAERLDHHCDAQLVGRQCRTCAGAHGENRRAAHKLQYRPSVEHTFLPFRTSSRLLRHVSQLTPPI